jgi:hypothetical protein
VVVVVVVVDAMVVAMVLAGVVRLRRQGDGDGRSAVIAVVVTGIVLRTGVIRMLGH